MQITSTNQMIWEIECLKKWCPIMEGDEIYTKKKQKKTSKVASWL